MRLTPLEVRAGQKKQLVEIFGIGNAFTTVESKYEQETDTVHSSCMAMKKGNWWSCVPRDMGQPVVLG